MAQENVMSAQNSWEEVRAKHVTTPERETEIARERAILELEQSLAGLRRHRGLSQKAIAEVLSISQPAVAKSERRGVEMQLSTIESYVGALGGRLELRAVFDNETIVINPKARKRSRAVA